MTMNNKTPCRAGIRPRGIGVSFSFVRRRQRMQPVDTGSGVHIDNELKPSAEEKLHFAIQQASSGRHEVQLLQP